MGKKIVFMFAALLLFGSAARAQWVTFDPSNLAQGIVNSSKQVIEASTTAQNMVNTFNETVKVYEQGKKYYDALKAVNNLVRDARKVQQTILLVGEISDMYIHNFRNMLNDKNFEPQELAVIAVGYTKLLQQSSFLLDDLKEITTITGLQMSDRERMEIIDNVYSDVLRFRNLTDYYTRKNISISYLRSKKAGDTERIRALYGSQDERYW